jgi:hypothetical protein
MHEFPQLLPPVFYCCCWSSVPGILMLLWSLLSMRSLQLLVSLLFLTSLFLLPSPLTLKANLLLVFLPDSGVLLLLGSPDVPVVSCTTVDPAVAGVLKGAQV